jgi:hypothetical protein
VPSGLYSHSDPADGTVLGYERFSCAPGPSGWRYTSDVLAEDGATSVGAVDVTVDRDWRPVRVEVRGGGWVVRGGAAGPEVVWVRLPEAGGGPAEGREGSAWAASFTGRSPVFAVVVGRLLRLAPGGSARVRLLALTEPVLAAHTVDEQWVLTEVTRHETPTVPLPVERYEVADLATGERRVLHMTGDVLVSGPGIGLEELESPPWLEAGEAGVGEEPQ